MSRKREPRPCLYCGKSFLAPPPSVSRPRGYCCSLSCGANFHHRQKRLAAIALCPLPELPPDATYRYIPLARPGKFIIVDAEDYPGLIDSNWMYVAAHGCEYARRLATPAESVSLGFPRKWGNVFVHREILGLLPCELAGMRVDHVDGNGLNNRRSNLRICTNSQNSMNRRPIRNKRYTSFKGIYFEPERLLWVAAIQVNGKTIKLGRFRQEEEAARAYDQAAKQHFGEFARLNFPV
jgi:hypothetical protein